MKFELKTVEYFRCVTYIYSRYSDSFELFLEATKYLSSSIHFFSTDFFSVENS